MKTLCFHFLLDDVINVSVIIDNVMVDKSAGEHIQSIQTSRRMNSMVYNSYADSFSRGQSCENGNCIYNHFRVFKFVKSLHILLMFRRF